MTMTHEALAIIEHDAALASVPVLNHYVDVVRNGLGGAPPDVKEHGDALLLKLAHLVRQQHAEPSSPDQEYLAPSLSLALGGSRYDPRSSSTRRPALFDGELRLLSRDERGGTAAASSGADDVGCRVAAAAR